MLRKGIFLIFIAFLPFASYSQFPEVFSLEQCIKLAEQHSYILQANVSDIAAAENVASIAGTYAIPRINGEVGTEQRFLKPYSYNQTWASVYADWSLGDYYRKTDRSAIQDIETQRIIKDQNLLDLSGRITSIYINILQIQKQIEILQVRRGFLQQHLNVTKGLWQAGLRSQLDVLQTETEIIAEQESISTLVSEKAILQSELIALLGMNISDSLHLKPISVENIINIPVPETSSENISNNPLLALYDSKIKVSKYQAEEVDAGKMPHLRLGSLFSTDGDPTGDGGFLGINAGVSVPIYYGKEFEYRKHLIENNILSLQSQKQNAEQELTIKLEQARKKLVQLKNILLIQYQKIEIAKTTVNYAEINYKAGISTNLELLTAQQILINSELASEETLIKYSMGLIDYYMITARVQDIISLGNIQQ